MNLSNILKSTGLFEDDPAQPVQPAETQEKAKHVDKPTATATTPLSALMTSAKVTAPVVTTTMPTSGSVDPEAMHNIMEFVRSKMQQNPAAAVINQFSATVEALTTIPDEGGRYRQALAIMEKVHKIGKDQLLAAFASMQQVIVAEQKTFESKIAQETATQVTARGTQLDEMNKKIAALIEQRDTLAGEKLVAETEIATKNASFAGAVTALNAEMGDSITKIGIYTTAATAKA